MLRHTLDLPLGKTVDYAVLIRKREDSPRTASTGETLSEKGGQQYDSRDAKTALPQQIPVLLGP